MSLGDRLCVLNLTTNPSKREGILELKTTKMTIMRLLPKDKTYIERVQKPISFIEIH